jgi:hypothetical protein
VVKGFIPTACYPSALAVSTDGKTLYIGIAKGSAAGPNVPYAKPPARFGRTPENLLDNPKRNATQYNYIGGLLRGFVYSLPIPDGRQLDAMTRAVEANTPAGAKGRIQETNNPVFSRIRHVLYVVRENRTYDQVFGDMPQGNGDPRLVLFGRRIAPNAHCLAENYVLLDNFYTNGEVSQDGHSWCDSAYATDFTQKAWLYRYSGRGNLDQDGRLSSFPGAYSPIADVADNDLALGRMVEAISHSCFWKETAIFVVEDDAQDGPDHVDSHRTVALVISPFAKRNAVDHTQYTQVSMVRTIELILGCNQNPGHASCD